jgi:renalase
VTADVTIVGGGISAAACANSIAKTNRELKVKVIDKATRPGGRLGSRTLELASGHHEVDIGAAYLTAHDPKFVLQVRDWCDRGLLRQWVDTLEVFEGDKRQLSTTGPMRYAANNGLRSLAIDSFAGAPETVTYEPHQEITQLSDALGPKTRVVVFACPVPQALRVLAPDLSAENLADLQRFSSKPVITAWGWFAQRTWPNFNAAFVNNHPDLTLIADDGARRGDGAPVLVAHSTNEYALQHQKVDGTASELIKSAMRLLNIEEPLVGASAHRWGLALPTLSDERPFWFSDSLRVQGNSPVITAICGDEWGGPPRIETAWLSGHRLGQFIAESLSC